MILNFAIVLVCLVGLSLKVQGQCYRNTIDIRVNQKGDLYSPGYRDKGKYPLLYFSCYRLTTDFGKRIRLHFEDFELERTEGCGGDQLAIKDGDSEHSPHLKTLCGYGRPRDILSTGNTLVLIFSTDFMIDKRGFHIVYSSTTDRTLCPGQFPCRNRKCVASSVICNKADDCEDGSDEAKCGSPLVTPSTCGLPTIQPRLDDNDERIVGGVEVIPGSWPWQAELQVDLIEPNGHVCGGSLINSQWVLSAAHCFQQNAVPGVWRIHLGKHHKFERDDSEQVRYAERIVLYPELTTKEQAENFIVNLDNDIALIKLQAPVTFSDKVNTICLPSASTVVRPGTECYAMGWGETRGSGGNDVLKQTKLVVHESRECNNEMMGFINESLVVCAGIRGGHHGPCHGDSGGPLVCKINDRWTVVGVASTVSDGNYMSALCAAKNVPTAYYKISSNWVNWIDRMIKKYT